MQGRRFRAFFAALAAAALCASLALSGFALAADTPGGAAARRTVRVGLPDTDTVSQAGGDTGSVAFVKAYLQAVAEYADWDCVYVPAPWQTCLDMVRNGELDVLLDVTKTDERLGWFDYSSESTGTEMCCLYGRKDTILRFNDFQSFDGMTVGCEAGSALAGQFQAYAGQKGFTFRTKTYRSGDIMFDALAAGEVDAVLQTNYYDAPADCTLLAKCCPNPIYIVTARGDPALKTELDEAMAQLFSYNPGFNSDMFKYHFGNAAAKSFGYTAAELAYLQKKPVVKVYYETNWEPFEYAQGGVAAGITPDVIRAIGEDTGIRFEFVLLGSTADVYSGVDGDTADTVMAVSYDYLWARQHDLLVTQPYVSGSCMRVSKTADVTPRTVAAVQDGYLENQVRGHYPALRILSYQTPAACMDAVARGLADCTFVSYYQASCYRSMSAYADLSYQPDESITQSIALGVTTNSDPALFDILSKSLQHLSAGTVQGILNKDSTRTEPLSFKLLMRRYPAEMAFGLGLLGVLAGLLVVLLMTASARKRRGDQLAEAKREAEAANAAKSDFLSRMSHDMRTPLNGIIGMTYLTEELALPDEARKNLKKIDTSSRFLLSLINDVLDMSKAESGKIELHPEPYPAAEFVEYVDAVIRPLCGEKNQRLDTAVKIPPQCVPLLDKLRVNQIVFNLLSNAVKYTPEGGAISYSSEAVKRADGRLDMTIRVADNGIGMSEEFQKTLFDPFTQEGRNDSSESRGSGLGLAITKKLVDLMGGSIAVESRRGAGSVFTVALQMDCAAPEGSGGGKTDACRESGGSLEGRHVLLCEDHPLNQEIAKALLEKKGVRVEIAEDGERGASMFSRSLIGYYDAILMDIRMPVMDGYEATRQIRALDRADAKTVPIIAMTADAFADDVQRCLDAGMNGHVAKPIDPETLCRELAKNLCPRSQN